MLMKEIYMAEFINRARHEEMVRAAEIARILAEVEREPMPRGLFAAAARRMSDFLRPLTYQLGSEFAGNGLRQSAR